ncbi:MAG: lipoprotein [Burkholderiaceae bacterium]|nr:lipoprotein [Burkholderiaceae bacterium]
MALAACGQRGPLYLPDPGGERPPARGAQGSDGAARTTR